MCFLLKMCILITVVEYTIGDQKCLPSDRNVNNCQDWKKMSVLVADLVGRSATENKVETQSSVLTLLLRVASSVIGRGSDALKTLIVNGMVLLTRTILTVSKYKTNINQSSKNGQKTKFFPSGHPIDWIMSNSYIKSTMDDATDGTLVDRLDRLAFGMPCVQLLVCRLSPIVRDMQRQVKKRWGNGPYQEEGHAWNVSDWQQVKASAKLCEEKYFDCTKTIELNSSS